MRYVASPIPVIEFFFVYYAYLKKKLFKGKLYRHDWSYLSLTTQLFIIEPQKTPEINI